MKDHEIKELINRVTALAVGYHNADSLRQVLSNALVPHLKPQPPRTTPAIFAQFETVGTMITGTTEAPIKRVEFQDDGSLLVTIDHWPYGHASREPKQCACHMTAPYRCNNCTSTAGGAPL